MNRDSRVTQGRPVLRNAVRAGYLGLISFAACGLCGCQSSSGGGAECMSAADCPSGEQCSIGQCLASAAGSAGMSNVGGAGFAGDSASGAGGASGAPSFAGASGSSVASSGGSGEQAGTGNSANFGGASGGGGSTANGGQNSAGSGGSSAGAGGMSEPDVVGTCKDDYWPATSNGSVTRYDFAQGTSLPACAYAITHKGAGRDGDWDTVEGISTGDGGYFGAMNTTDYNNGAACGACAEITYNGGKKLVITIVDECPVSSNKLCVKGHIDLSRKAIRQLQPNASLEHLGNGGDGSISWRYVTCPAIGDAKMRLHPNQSSNWQPVVVENGLYPLSKVTINGANATRAGNNSGGNAWLASGQKLPFTVRATDVNGDTVQANFAGGSGLTDIGKQFMCSK